VSAAEGWELFPDGSFEIDGETLSAQGADASGDAGANSFADLDSLFPPKADFANKVDYVQWLYDNYINLATDNAFNAYFAFMPLEDDGNGALWDAVEKTMLNDDSFKGPLGPWDPAAHPEWEAGLTGSGPLLDWFRQATWHADFATLPVWGSDGAEQHELVNILLPFLGRHRKLVKATLSDAWRMENGRVSGDRMLSAIDTSLRGAGHMMQGISLIERLVSIHERMVTEETARQALAQGVFSTPEQIVSAYNTLVQLDTDDGDPAEWLRCEYAAQMDLVQRLFTEGADGQPHIDPAALQKFASTSGLKEPAVQAIAQLGPEDAARSVQAIDECYHKMAEQVRNGDLDVEKPAMEALQTNALLKEIIPCLARTFELRRRAQTSRRATQLAYAVRIFASQNGRWPVTLDELGPEYGQEIRIDPYSGGHFGYRLTETGPMIYSCSVDGRDDGGKHISTWDNPTWDKRDDQTGDFVFWPPQ
jgi:hypothetical protein